MLGHWAGEWPRSQQKYALDQLASGTSGRLQGGRVSSDVHVLRLGLGTGSRQHLATPQNICEESRSTRTWNGSYFITYFIILTGNAERLPLIFPDAWPLNGYSTGSKSTLSGAAVPAGAPMTLVLYGMIIKQRGRGMASLNDRFYRIANGMGSFKSWLIFEERKLKPAPPAAKADSLAWTQRG